MSVWIKVWLIAHVIVVTSWSLPHSPPGVYTGAVPPTLQNVAANPVDYFLGANDHLKTETPVRFYLISTGLWQYWDMFAPNPMNTDYWVDAIITYKDGTAKICVYPRIKDMPLWQKYLKERYRKYLERSMFDVDSWKWPSFAQRMALLGFYDRNNPPVRVQLRRHFRQIPDYGMPSPSDYTEYVYFDYVVDQDRLLKDAGP